MQKRREDVGKREREMQLREKRRICRKKMWQRESEGRCRTERGIGRRETIYEREIERGVGKRKREAVGKINKEVLKD